MRSVLNAARSVTDLTALSGMFKAARRSFNHAFSSPATESESTPSTLWATEPASTSNVSTPSGVWDNTSRSSILIRQPLSIWHRLFARPCSTLRRMVGESHLTPQFSGRATPCEARRERIKTLDRELKKLEQLIDHAVDQHAPS